jgi:ABC-type antimicrobial peptide transport system permease subunit
MRAAAAFTGALSGVGLVLALVGLYGSVSYAVGRRTREMGIRAALGATRSRMVWTALQGAATVLGAGALTGMALAAATIRPLADLLPDGVEAWSPAMFAATAGLVILTGMAAAAVPARRAARVDAAVALREE